mmetsp:Transcript_19815/g.30613  ORF Transcript_19815/g.30613 Transcript_19815/m.30613 type:complete len:228 (+) Transcript_19815:115-798(+)|eukprot:CAMPEP_0195282072 /NCGR_PEP_ID=MMETSP0707-20130614/1117_1 /TAXON_ID=33640 /ORGANISM="Asterionellopsis glacialis, Strain CCMP134" /LENGTH=227 /DNA_ID=CAMNT_0040341023 /DNA_START=51 /DNA_END=734 /DNA_ORIENTATION=-
MPPLLTQVARVSDGLPLVANTSSSSGVAPVTTQSQQQAKQILRSLMQGSPSRMSIESGPHTFYYLVRENLCFLSMFESSYPKRVAFLYLDEVADAILAELLQEFQNDWRAQVDTAARPFRFIHYDPLLQKKCREFQDPKQVQSQNSSRLQDDLSEIQGIMKKNIDELLNRGERLEHVSNVSKELQAKSKDFKWGAKKLTWQARLQQYGPFAAGAIFVVFVLYMKFFR